MSKLEKDTTTIDDLAKLLGLPAWDKIRDMNEHAIAEASGSAYRQALREGKREPGAEKASHKAEQAAEAELFQQWYDAVEYVATELLGKHGLALTSRYKTSNKRPYELRVVPQKSWDEAVSKIRQTINGVGDYNYRTTREFLQSGPYTARQAVLSHLGYIRHYPAIYGGGSPSAMYESRIR